MKLKSGKQNIESGEGFIQNHINEFLKTKGSAYKEERNFPNIEATSMLSPYLNSGVVSSKWCLLKAKEFNNGLLDNGDKGIVHWVSEILWREFYRHILYNFPKVSRDQPFISYTKNIPWRESHEELNKWKKAKPEFQLSMRACEKCLQRVDAQPYKNDSSYVFK